MDQEIKIIAIKQNVCKIKKMVLVKSKTVLNL